MDQAPTTAENKLLQLHQYLSGEALKIVENLGHSTDLQLIKLPRKDYKESLMDNIDKWHSAWSN